MDSEASSSTANDSSGEETSSVGMDSADNSYANIVSGYSVRLDDMVYDALATIDDEHDGTGRDIDGIFEFNKERYKISESHRELLRDEVENLVSEGQVEKETATRSPFPSRVPATEVSTEESATSQEPPSTSFVPTASEEDVIDAAVKVVAEAEHFEFQAKEASELADRHVQILNLESNIILQLAIEILNLCANGEKVFLR